MAIMGQGQDRLTRRLDLDGMGELRAHPVQPSVGQHGTELLRSLEGRPAELGPAFEGRPAELGLAFENRLPNSAPRSKVAPPKLLGSNIRS